MAKAAGFVRRMAGRCGLRALLSFLAMTRSPALPAAPEAARTHGNDGRIQVKNVVRGLLILEKIVRDVVR